MRITALFMLLLLGCRLHAQSTDWLIVERLPSGTRVHIVNRHRTPCTLVSATDRGLECERRGFHRWVDRDDIRRILIASNSGAVIGTALGAAAGGAIETVSDESAEKAGKPVRIVAAAALGGFVGFLVGHLSDATKYRVLYEHP